MRHGGVRCERWIGGTWNGRGIAWSHSKRFRCQLVNTGLSNENGNSLVVQVMSEANPALQNFFMENCNSAAPGQVPSVYTYVPTPVGLDVQGVVANAAGNVLTAAGRFGTVAVAGAAIPSPYAPRLATAVIGMVADAVVQVVRPDVGQYWTNRGAP